MEDLKGICLSGGALGSDLQWGMCAGKDGQAVFHYTFTNHRSQAPASEQIILDDKQLKEAEPHVKKASVYLGRNYPKRFPVYHLIHRNYYQVANSDRVYAVTDFDEDGKPTGGTAWAIAMYLLKPDSKCECYVYSQKKGSWFSYKDGTWVTIEEPPKPHGVWAGIGTRDLKTNGKEAIRALLGYVKS